MIRLKELLPEADERERGRNRSRGFEQT